MKKFNFRYQKILQVRLDKENEVRNTLGKINKVVLEKETELKSIKDRNESFLDALNHSIKKGLFVSEMQAVASNKKFFIDKIDGLTHELSVLLEQRLIVQKELIECNKQRKIMEKLREKEVLLYKAFEAMEESKVIDQIVTYQSTKSRGEK